MLYLDVFDFDYTIYDGDVTLDFYLYCLKKHPYLIRYIPKQIFHLLKYLLNFEKKSQFKGHFFCFLKGLRCVDLIVNDFWEIHFGKIKSWYLAKARSSDVIISASPEFLLKFICANLEVHDVIASIVDPYTGLFYGENCYGTEKVCRFKLKYPNYIINHFYSDSLSDLPLAQIAHKSYLVKGNKIEEWKQA